MRSLDELIGLPLVLLDQGLQIGRLRGVEIDPAAGRIRYLRFDGDHGHRDGIVPWEAIRAIGVDAITVESESRILNDVPPPERPNLTPHVGDRPVVTESGSRVGTIHSYQVDEATGEIVGYCVRTGRGFLSRFTGHDVELPPTAIRTFGRDAIIVDDAVLPAKAA
jgi:sporulation protein YlmC with PRC-barrel domain